MQQRDDFIDPVDWTPDGQCVNPLCRRPLGFDPTVLVTTKHVRLFCGVPCLIESYHHNLDKIWREVVEEAS